VENFGVFLYLLVEKFGAKILIISTCQKSILQKLRHLKRNKIAHFYRKNRHYKLFWWKISEYFYTNLWKILELLYMKKIL